MKKLIILLFTSVALLNCKKGNTEDKNNNPELEGKFEEEMVRSDDPTHEENKPEVTFIKNFDWTEIPQSESKIGVFPHITIPNDMVITENGYKSDLVATEQLYSKAWDNDYLSMSDGTNVFVAKGRRAEIFLVMKNKKEDFSELEFEEITSKYLKSIGAVKIFEGELSEEQKNVLKENYSDFDKHMNNHIDLTKMYALNHKNGKIFFHTASSDKEGSIEVVQLEGFKKIVKIISASEIKSAIDKEEKAILNIKFNSNEATLKSGEQKIIEQIEVLLKEDPELELSIEGHTEDTGDRKHDKELSEKRTETIMYALAAKGIEIKRLSAKGYGSSKPIEKSNNNDNKVTNNRIELVKK